MNKILASVAAGAVVALTPMTAHAGSICLGTNGPMKDREVVICFFGGGLWTEPTCSRAQARFYERLFKRKPPVPLPYEVMCTYFGKLVIPIPEVSPIDFDLQDPIEPPVVKYAQLGGDQVGQTARPLEPWEQAGFESEEEYNRHVNRLIAEARQSYSSSCGSNIFNMTSGSSDSCVMRVAQQDTPDYVVNYQKTRIYIEDEPDIFVLTTRSQSVEGAPLFSEMRFRNGRMFDCSSTVASGGVGSSACRPYIGDTQGVPTGPGDTTPGGPGTLDDTITPDLRQDDPGDGIMVFQ